jgi:hypothetical protein
MLDHIDELLRNTGENSELKSLKHRAEKIKAELEAIDINLFHKLRTDLKTQGYTGAEFKNLVNEYVDLTNNGCHNEAGYDNLDLFINNLLPLQAMPGQTRDLEPEMVYYQKTPARIVFELARQIHFTEGDVFFDLGSGLGQAAMLVNLLSGVTVKGIEFEPAFCAYATQCAAALNLANITFINTDARKADYTGGTVFFMFTPFKGQIMLDVLAALQKESLRRKITIITYGPCTAQVASQSWLHCANLADGHIYKLAVFTSL